MLRPSWCSAGPTVPGLPDPVRQHVIRNEHGEFQPPADLAWARPRPVHRARRPTAQEPTRVYDARRETAVVAATGPAVRPLHLARGRPPPDGHRTATGRVGRSSTPTPANALSRSANSGISDSLENGSHGPCSDRTLPPILKGTGSQHPGDRGAVNIYQGSKTEHDHLVRVPRQLAPCPLRPMSVAPRSLSTPCSWPSSPWCASSPSRSSATRPTASSAPSAPPSTELRAIRGLQRGGPQGPPSSCFLTYRQHGRKSG